MVKALIYHEVDEGRDEKAREGLRLKVETKEVECRKSKVEGRGSAPRRSSVSCRGKIVLKGKGICIIRLGRVQPT